MMMNSTMKCLIDLSEKQKANVIPHVFLQQQLLPHAFWWSLEPNAEETMGQLLQMTTRWDSSQLINSHPGC